MKPHVRNSPSIRKLFEDHKRERAIIRSVLELGRGDVFVDNSNEPKFGLLVFKPLIFLGGDSESETAVKWVRNAPEMRLLIPPDNEWDRLIRRELLSRLMVQKRTCFNPDTLELEHVRNLKKEIPSGFELGAMDREAVEGLDKTLIQPIELFFESVDEFLEMSIGFCVKRGEEVASMACPAFPFVEEFEIQVVTLDRPEFRRKGLATVVCAALIEYALENDLIPHWDAANEASVNLALKLGYSDPDRWYAYFWKK